MCAALSGATRTDMEGRYSRGGNMSATVTDHIGTTGKVYKGRGLSTRHFFPPFLNHFLSLLTYLDVSMRNVERDRNPHLLHTALSSHCIHPGLRRSSNACSTGFHSQGTVENLPQTEQNSHIDTMLYCQNSHSAGISRKENMISRLTQRHRRSSWCGLTELAGQRY